MIERLLLFGATGDLVGRFLLPAFAELYDEGKLPEGFRVVGAAIEDWDDETFRRHAARQLEEHAAGDVSAASREALVRSLSYRRAKSKYTPRYRGHSGTLLALKSALANRSGDEGGSSKGYACEEPPRSS